MRLVDTSAWVHALRPDGDAAVRERVRALLVAGEAAWCPPVRLELWNGARGSHEKAVIRDMEHRVAELDVSPETWETACELARSARTKGLTVPAIDVLISACARHHGVEIEHADAHFDQLAGL